MNPDKEVISQIVRDAVEDVWKSVTYLDQLYENGNQLNHIDADLLCRFTVSPTAGPLKEYYGKNNAANSKKTRTARGTKSGAAGNAKVFAVVSSSNAAAASQLDLWYRTEVVRSVATYFEDLLNGDCTVKREALSWRGDMQKGSHVVDMNYLLRGSLAFTVMFSWMESIPIFFDFVEENKSTDGTGEWEDGVHRPEGVSQTDLFFGLLAGTVREEDVHPSLSPTVVGDWCYLLLTSNCDDFPLEEFAKFVHLLHQCAVYEQSLEDLEPVKPSVLCLRCLLVFLAEQDRLCTRLRSLFTSGPSTADQCETLPEDVLASIHSLFENMSDESDEVCRIGVAVVLCEPYWMHQLVSGGEVSFDSLWGAFVAKESECVSE